jgi:hypothetical protein
VWRRGEEGVVVMRQAVIRGIILVLGIVVCNIHTQMMKRRGMCVCE